MYTLLNQKYKPQFDSITSLKLNLIKRYWIVRNIEQLLSGFSHHHDFIIYCPNVQVIVMLILTDIAIVILHWRENSSWQSTYQPLSQIVSTSFSETNKVPIIKKNTKTRTNWFSLSLISFEWIILQFTDKIFGKNMSRGRTMWQLVAK